MGVTSPASGTRSDRARARARSPSARMGVRKSSCGHPTPNQCRLSRLASSSKRSPQARRPSAPAPWSRQLGRHLGHFSQRPKPFSTDQPTDQADGPAREPARRPDPRRRNPGRTRTDHLRGARPATGRGIDRRTSRRGETPITRRTDQRGRVRFTIRGVQAQSEPIFFQAWIAPRQGAPTGFSNLLAIQFVKR